jgi:hypothetical protein
MLKKEDYVKVTKLDAQKNPTFRTPEWDEYEPGGWDNVGMSLPKDYWLTGKILVPPQVGRSTVVSRDTRNGERVDGRFTSSVVKEIITDPDETKAIVKTLNSVYLFEKIEEPQCQ